MKEKEMIKGFFLDQIQNHQGKPSLFIKNELLQLLSHMGTQKTQNLKNLLMSLILDKDLIKKKIWRKFILDYLANQQGIPKSFKFLSSLLVKLFGKLSYKQRLKALPPSLKGTIGKNIYELEQKDAKQIYRSFLLSMKEKQKIPSPKNSSSINIKKKFKPSLPTIIQEDDESEVKAEKQKIKKILQRAIQQLEQIRTQNKALLETIQPYSQQQDLDVFSTPPTKKVLILGGSNKRNPCDYISFINKGYEIYVMNYNKDTELQEGCQIYECPWSNGGEKIYVNINGIYGDFNNPNTWKNLKEMKKGNHPPRKQKFSLSKKQCEPTNENLLFDLIVFDWSTSKFFEFGKYGLLTSIMEKVKPGGKFYLPLENYFYLLRGIKNPSTISLNKPDVLKKIEQNLKSHLENFYIEIIPYFEFKKVKGMPFYRKVGGETWGTPKNLFYEIVKPDPRKLSSRKD